MSEIDHINGASPFGGPATHRQRVMTAPTATATAIELADGQVEHLGWPIVDIEKYLHIAGCTWVWVTAESPGGRIVPLLIEANRIALEAA